MSDVSIAFASTGYGPVWAPAVSSWLRAVAYGARHFHVEHIGKVGGAGVTDRQYTHMAENALVQDFLNSQNTHLFLTEADMILPHDVLPLLYETSETGKDMVSGIYYLRANKPEERGQPCLFKRPELTNPSDPWGQVPVTIFPHDRPFRVDCAGVGCVLIRRHVLETTEYPWFDLSAKQYGSDMYFYAKCRQKGFLLWADPRVQAQQIDYYITDEEDYKTRLEREPDFPSRGFLAGITGRSAT